MKQDGKAEADGKERMTVRGVRLTVGNAVDCTQVRTDDGRVLGVSYLEPAIAIGDRVEVTGFMANVTDCVGQVIYVEKATKLGG